MGRAQHIQRLGELVPLLDFCQPGIVHKSASGHNRVRQKVAQVPLLRRHRNVQLVYPPFALLQAAPHFYYSPLQERGMLFLSSYSNLRTILCFACDFCYPTTDTEPAEMFVRMTHQGAYKNEKPFRHTTFVMKGDYSQCQ